MSYNPLRGNVVQYTVTGVDGKVRRTVSIRLKAQTMMHDFSLTEKYVVLYDLPVALERFLLGGDGVVELSDDVTRVRPPIEEVGPGPWRQPVREAKRSRVLCGGFRRDGVLPPPFLGIDQAR